MRTKIRKSGKGASLRRPAEIAEAARDAYDVEAMARKIQLVLTTPSEARRLRESGFARSAQFSWHRTARRILEAYGRAVDGPAVVG